MKKHFTELVRRASSILPADVSAALLKAAGDEEAGGRARHVLLCLLENARAAEAGSLPICQDTGTLIFHVGHGPEFSQFELEAQIMEAVSDATAMSYLRPNAVDPITGANSGNNLGRGSPLVLFRQRPDPGLCATLLLKGGGSENASAQYSLPDAAIGAGRDLDGVRRCILHAAHLAQGRGCAPGTLGVGVGGDRMTSYLCAKEQLLRKLDDTNSDPRLGALETRVRSEVNSLGIGPMGFGGRTTVLGVKIGARHRLPASFFVSIAYMCWALRRCTMTIRDGVVEYSS